MRLKRGFILLYSLAVIMLLSLPACQPQNVSNYYQGLRTNPAESLSLSGKEPQSGQWQTFDMLLDYRYQAGGGTLRISGNAALSEFYQLNINVLRKLDIYLFFLDENARVLETVLLVNALSSNPESPLSFQKELTIPSAATAIDFGYDGVARGDQMLRRFHKLPK